MSSAGFLNQDFGSESEDEAFNPAPAEESDNDAPRDSDDDRAVNGKSNGSHEDRQPSAQQVHDEVEGDTQLSPSTRLIDQDTGDSASRKTKRGDGDDMKPRTIGGMDGARDNDEEDVDDDEEDEEDDEEAISGRPRKRARRDPRNQFIDEEAEVDEEDEGDEEDEEGNPDGFIAETHPDDNLDDLPENVAIDDTRHRDLDRQREKAAQLDAEHEAQRLRETYGRRQATNADAFTVPKRLLLPSVDDPSIWGVKCKPGKEREIVFALMKRIEERAFTKNPLPIISALERKNISGYLYVEARRQADVLTALEGIMNVYPRSPITLVPIKEMPDLLRVTKSEQLQPGGYVRIKRGKYANDLAQIDDVETNGLDITLRVVPRLDYGQNDDGSAPMVDGGIRVHGEIQKRKRLNAMGLTNASSRPPPRLFSEQEAKKKHSKFLNQVSTMNTHHWQYHGDTYINGFLIKDFKIQHLITENVNPTLEEVTRFSAGAEDGAENLDLAALAATLKKSTANDHYLPGDMVEVFDGEQQGAYGKAIQVRGDIITMTVLDGDLRGQIIEVPQKGLRKRFRTGDHVKVIGGSRYRDEVGMVVSINADQVTVLSDLSMQEITVFSKDLREASDSGVAGGLGRYDIHDLVQLDPATVGCVTKVDRESLRVLDQVGSVRSVMPSQISNKIEKRRNAVATDRNGSEIRTDDTVREIGGEQKQGVILHIYRSFLFLHNREQTDNSGISVVRTTNVATVAAKGGRVAQGAGSGPDLNKMNPALMRNGVNGSAQMPPPKSFGRDRALGQTVTVRRGAYKGLLGIVKDTTDLEARVELHTKGKTVTVPKDTLGFKDSLTGLSIGYAQFAGSRGRGGGGQGGYSNMGSATPGRMQDYSAGRTPLAVAGGRTPAWGAGSGGRTPAFTGANSTAKTPMWRSSVETSANGGGRTPAYTSSADGSRTVNPYADGSRTVNPYGGSTAYGGPSGGGGGGRTPAWNPTATASSYSQDPFANTNGGGGGRTPAYEPSYSRTPGPAALSSRPYDAPTPGKDFATAPTPSANGGSSYVGGGGGGSGGGGGNNVGGTPAAGGGSAPTPKFSGDAPTPFAGQPETPGWGAGDDDDGPRYEEGTPSP